MHIPEKGSNSTEDNPILSKDNSQGLPPTPPLKLPKLLSCGEAFTKLFFQSAVVLLSRFVDQRYFSWIVLL